MKEDETASAICGQARAASERGDDGKAQLLFVLALAKAEDVHGPDSMMVGLVLNNLIKFHQKANRADEALLATNRLEYIVKRHGVAGAEIEAMWLPQKGLFDASEA
jgi:hypothetical protein